MSQNSQKILRKKQEQNKALEALATAKAELLHLPNRVDYLQANDPISQFATAASNAAREFGYPNLPPSAVGRMVSRSMQQGIDKIETMLAEKAWTVNQHITIEKRVPFLKKYRDSVDKGIERASAKSNAI